MNMTDPVADMLTRLRNALLVSKREVEIPFSHLKKAVADVLVREGYLGEAEVVGEGVGKKLRLTLKYGPDGEKVITTLKRRSTPGRRVYKRGREIPRVLEGLGIAVLSTSKGVLSDRECRRAGVGGELICVVW